MDFAEKKKFFFTGFNGNTNNKAERKKILDKRKKSYLNESRLLWKSIFTGSLINIVISSGIALSYFFMELCPYKNTTSWSYRNKREREE